jgi:hypothetical protein
MSDPTLTPAEWFALIEDRAKGLRDAGVTRINLDGVLIELAPAEPPPERPSKREAPDDELDALLDGTTYGRRDGSVPGFRLHTGEEEN